MKRGSCLKRTRTLGRAKKPMRTKGPIARIRADGNRAAKEHYFGKMLIKPCQSCGDDLTLKFTESHHKKQKGEAFENKLALCHKCHVDFIHDHAHPERRLAARMSEANVVNGKSIRWDLFGLLPAFQAFRTGKPQPKGVHIPGHQLPCQGCKVQAVPGSKLELIIFCLVHHQEQTSPLFGDLHA